MAIEITQKEMAADPSNMDSYAVMCWSLNSLKRYSEAISIAQKGRQINSTDHRLVEVLAEASFALRNDASALSYYQQYIVLATAHEVDNRYIREAYRQMGEIFIHFTEYHHADIALVAAIQYDKGKTANDSIRASRLWSRLGYVREKLGDVAASMNAYEKALSLDAANTEAISGRDRLKALAAT
jgi:tetratricopeptide (TPR) repeat protein